jgi:hypothetical protein
VKIDFSGNEISYTRQKSKEHKRKDKVTRIGKGDYVYSGVVQPAMNCFSCF